MNAGEPPHVFSSPLFTHKQQWPRRQQRRGNQQRMLDNDNKRRTIGNVKVSNKSPPPPPFFTQETGAMSPTATWQPTTDEQGHTRMRATDNNQVSSVQPPALYHLHRRSRSHVAVGDVATIRLQTTMKHHDAPY